MKKTDKSAEEMYLYWVDQMQPKGTNCSTEDEITIYRAIHEFAAQQFSEYKEVVKKMIPIVESFNYKDYNPYKAIIDRAKALLQESNQGQPPQAEEQP